MTNEDAIKFGKEQLEIFGSDSKMGEFIRIAIEVLKSEQPKGKWIAIHKGYVCSNCNKYTITINDKHYCFKCGADMRGDV